MRVILLLLLLPSVLMGQSITLIDYIYNDDCTITWSYQVCNSGEKNNISHFVFELCDHPCLVSVDGDNIGIVSDDEISTGDDPFTSSCGLKFDDLPGFDCLDVSFTTQGHPELDEIGVILKAGLCVFPKTVLGPAIIADCNCGVLAIDILSFDVRYRDGYNLSWELERDAETIIVQEYLAGRFIAVAILDGDQRTFIHKSGRDQGVYRLEVYDVNGDITHSEIESARAPESDAEYNYYNLLGLRVEKGTLADGVYFAIDKQGRIRDVFFYSRYADKRFNISPK